uniref:DYW domain-containing protein n=1 Tax=Oryza punctata TaxID=4537 RepID=A0A0E0KRY5_ORYPU
MQTTVLLLNPNDATYIRRKGLPLTVVLGTALVDLYAKCGCSDNADKHSSWWLPVRNSEEHWGSSHPCVRPMLKPTDVAFTLHTNVDSNMQDALKHPLDPNQSITLDRSRFFAEDSDHPTHPQLTEIYEKAEEMVANDVRLDFDQNEKEASVTHHSKKLAIAFSLMKLRLGATIQLSKNLRSLSNNLRVCLDCHSTTELIAKVYNREIVVRGKNRFQSLQRWLLLLQ